MTKARSGGNLPADITDHMLRHKFRSGLRSESLKSALRSRVESENSFDSILVYARTIEQEASGGGKTQGK